MKISPASQYYGYMDYNTGVASSTLRFSTIGDGDTSWTTGGLFEVASYADATTAGISFMGDNRGAPGPSFGVARLTQAAPVVTDWYFAFSEKAGVDTSNGFSDQALVGLDLNFASSTFNYDSQTAGALYITKKDYMLYNYAGPVSVGVTTVKEGGYTERGSQFSSVDDTAVNFNMANKLAKTQFTLASSGSNLSAASTCVKTLGVGESYVCSGVTVKVTDITETVGACTAGGASASCGSADMSGVSAKVVDDSGAEVAKGYTVNANAYKGLVILDTDAVGVNTLVSVGGDKVNTVTAALLQGSPVDWTTQKTVVKEVVQGSKIVVAGAEAADTLQAANDFIAAVKEA
ncbi:Uncharacterised protein [uncultured archaeon]|nr:Uncharacterised protein [uncultured archaeon]